VSPLRHEGYAGQAGFRCQQTAQQCGFMKLAFKFVRERFLLASRRFSSGVTAIKIDPPQADSMFDVGLSMFDVH